MKYIAVPEQVTLKNLEDEAIKDSEGNEITLTLQDFIRQRLGDVKFAEDMDSVLSVVQIKQALKESEGQDFIAIETKDWEKLAELVRHPSSPYNPAVASSLVTFMKAVTEASNEKPGFVKTGNSN